MTPSFPTRRCTDLKNTTSLPATTAAATPRRTPKRPCTPATSGDRATPTTIPTARRVTMSGAVVTIAQEASAITATQANTTADIGSMSTTTGSGLGGASPSPDALVTIGTVGAGGCDPGDPSARAPQPAALLGGGPPTGSAP